MEEVPAMRMLEAVVPSNQQFTYFLRNGAFSPNSIEAVIQEGFRTSTTPLSITSFRSYAVGKQIQENLSTITTN
jgi:hypothetical protein